MLITSLYLEHFVSLLCSLTILQWHFYLSKRLNKDRKTSAKYCDVTLIVDEHKYPAHKCILSVMSPFFAKILCDEMKKHCTDKIVVEGVCQEVFEIILDSIYTGSVTVNNETSYPFAEFVDYLGITYYVRTAW